MMRNFRSAYRVAAVAGLAVASQTHAQLATALIREGDTLSTGDTVAGVAAVAANRLGGFAFITTPPTGGLNHIWGTATGSNPAVLVTEGTYNGYTQTSFETSAFGISDTASAGYSATVTQGDSMWVDTTPVTIDGEPSTVPGFFWVFSSRPKMTAAGDVYFGAGLSTTSGGSTVNRGLFKGSPAQPVLLGNDVVPALPAPLAPSESYFDARYSTDGQHYMVPVTILTGSTTTDRSVVLDGGGMMVGGTLVQEGSLVPVSAGGDGTELWQNFGSVSINNNRDYIMSGDTNRATATDDYLLLTGQMILRAGDVLPNGQTITGAVGEVQINNDGDWGALWSTILNGVTAEVILFNGEVIVREGDPIDFDGNGQADPGVTISDLTNITGLAFGDRDAQGRVAVYLTGLVDTLGTTSTTDDFASGIRIDIQAGSGSSCYANCDSSTNEPVLNVADFTCFLQRFAAGESYANCDESTTPPVLNVADFTCFLQAFAAGCP
jgi:hypothetical protein